MLGGATVVDANYTIDFHAQPDGRFIAQATEDLAYILDGDEDAQVGALHDVHVLHECPYGRGDGSGDRSPRRPSASGPASDAREQDPSAN